jgi:polysaccharide deacetylase
MISPKLMGAIITALVVIVGVVLIYPAFRLDGPVAHNQVLLPQKVLLTINIINSTNLPTWCNDLSKLLQDNNIQSTIFITGIMADTYPNCVTSLGNKNDVGSMTYSYDTITALDYTGQLKQIMDGKAAIDKQGKLNSTIFRAPHGIVDNNIYSLLARSHILGDFSYTDHYNVYSNGLSGKTFYRFPMTSWGNTSDAKLSEKHPNVPVMVNIYNYDSTSKVQELIDSESKNPHQFITASELIREIAP